MAEPDALLHALHRPGGLPWLTDIARRFEALAVAGQAPGPAEYADMLHGIVSIGVLLTEIAAQLQAEQAALTGRAAHHAALDAARAAQLSELSDELAGQAEELQQLVAIADARLTALRRATDR